MRPSERLSRIPPYLFAELERKIAAKKAAGVDVISLGIGDPDRPTPPLIVEAMQEAVTEPETHQYPSNRGRADFREALSDFYARRFDVTLDPATEIIPAIGAKEAIFNLNLAFLDPGDVALAADPGYPVYTGGPLLVGGEPVVMPLVPELGFVPDLDAIDEVTASRAKLMYLNYPNNPTGAVVPHGFFERVIDFARTYEILVVHDNAYSETTYDGYRAPSFLATPGAKEVGIEVFSLSKGYNMTGWRCAAVLGNAEVIEHYWRLKTNIDSGLFDAVQLAGVAALSPDTDAEVASMNELYRRRRDLVCEALAKAGVHVTPP
jgi:LL-diaminopimelate aminotransferase